MAACPKRSAKPTSSRCASRAGTRRRPRAKSPTTAATARWSSASRTASAISTCWRRASATVRIARGMVPFNVAYLGDGRFHKGVAGRPLRRGSARETPRAGRAHCVRAGRASVSDDMLGIAWGKLLINLNNAVNALSGRTLIDELRERDYRRVFAASMREGLRLLRARRTQAGEGRPVRRRGFCRGSSARPTGCSTTSSSSGGRSTPRRARRWPTISPPGARPRSIISTATGRSWPSGWARTRRSTARSSSWSARPKPAPSRAASSGRPRR